MTDLEHAYLEAIASSDFRMDWSRDAVIANAIYAWDPADQLGLGKRAGGVAASLSKKGFVVCDHFEGEDDAITMTAAGWDAMTKRRR